MFEACWPDKATGNRTKFAIMQRFEGFGYGDAALGVMETSLDGGRMLALGLPCTNESLMLVARRTDEAEAAWRQVVIKKVSER